MGRRDAGLRLMLFAPSTERALRKLPDGNFRRSLVRSLRACSSAEVAALGCIAAARIGFFLAALHSVAKSISRRPAYHPTQPVPVHKSRWEKSREARCRAKRQDARFLLSFPPRRNGGISPSTGTWERSCRSWSRGRGLQVTGSCLAVGGLA